RAARDVVVLHVPVPLAGGPGRPAGLEPVARGTEARVVRQAGIGSRERAEIRIAFSAGSEETCRRILDHGAPRGWDGGVVHVLAARLEARWFGWHGQIPLVHEQLVPEEAGRRRIRAGLEGRVQEGPEQWQRAEVRPAAG